MIFSKYFQIEKEFKKIIIILKKFNILFSISFFKNISYKLLVNLIF